jgi:hypothetical protein
MEIGQAVLQFLYGRTENASKQKYIRHAPRGIPTLDPDVRVLHGRLCIWQFFRSKYTEKRANFTQIYGANFK